MKDPLLPTIRQFSFDDEGEKGFSWGFSAVGVPPFYRGFEGFLQVRLRVLCTFNTQKAFDTFAEFRILQQPSNFLNEAGVPPTETSKAVPPEANKPSNFLNEAGVPPTETSKAAPPEASTVHTWRVGGLSK